MNRTTRETQIERQYVILKECLPDYSANKLGLKDSDKKKDKPLLALIIGELLSKGSSAEGNLSPQEKTVAKGPLGAKSAVVAKASEEAAPAPVTQEAYKKDQESEDSHNQKSLKLKSQKTADQAEPAKNQQKAEPSDDNEFDDYEQEFGDEFGEEVEEGIKVSSSDIEPVITIFGISADCLEQPPGLARDRNGKAYLIG